jgi:hypothetical protein
LIEAIVVSEFPEVSAGFQKQGTIALVPLEVLAKAGCIPFFLRIIQRKTIYVFSIEPKDV